MSRLFGWDLPPGVSPRDLEPPEQWERELTPKEQAMDLICEGAENCPNHPVVEMRITDGADSYFYTVCAACREAIERRQETEG